MRLAQSAKILPSIEVHHLLKRPLSSRATSASAAALNSKEASRGTNLEYVFMINDSICALKAQHSTQYRITEAEWLRERSA